MKTPKRSLPEEIQIWYHIAHVLSVLLMLSTLLSPVAQNDEDESTDQVPGLELFDEDVENTRKGLASQLHMYPPDSCTWTPTAAFSARLPDGNNCDNHRF